MLVTKDMFSATKFSPSARVRDQAPIHLIKGPNPTNQSLVDCNHITYYTQETMEIISNPTILYIRKLDRQKLCIWSKTLNKIDKLLLTQFFLTYTTRESN